MLNIEELLNSQTSQTTEANLKQIEQALEQTQQELQTLNDEREAVLLSLDEAAADQHDQNIATTQRQVDRLTAAQKVLQTKYTEQCDAEAKAEAQKLVHIGQQAMERGLTIYEDYRKHAEAIVKLLQELPACYERIKTGMSAAKQAGLEHQLNLPHSVLSEPSEYIPEKREILEQNGEKINAITQLSRWVKGSSAPDLTDLQRDYVVLTRVDNKDLKLWPIPKHRDIPDDRNALEDQVNVA